LYLYQESGTLSKTKGFMAVAVTKHRRTVRELRADAHECAACGASGRTLYDYVDGLTGNPAFCNKTCWMDYEFDGRLRDVSSIEEAPAAKSKPNPKQTPYPKRRAAPKRSRKGKLALVS
jgi:hypothetical protein